MPVKGGRSIYISANNTVRLFWYTTNKTYIGTEAVLVGNYGTIPDNAAYFRIIAINSVWDDPVMINYGTTAAPYTPYVAPHTATISFGQTVYGGTINFKTGVLQITKGFKTYTGDESEYWRASGTANAYYINISDAVANDTSLLCNRGKRSSSLDNVGDCLINAYKNFTYKSDDIETVSDWKTYLASNPLQVCYELATPTTVQLTPAQLTMLKGYNYLSGDGTITITAYVKTT